MPRPRVRDEDRKRVARACDTCKRRKEKCDGSHPCLLCKRRGREPECTFTEGFSTRRSSTKRDSTSTNTTSIAYSHSYGQNHSQLSPIDPLLNNNPLPPPRSNSRDYPAITSNGTNSVTRRVTLQDAYRPANVLNNTDQEIAIESLLTLSSGSATNTRPGSATANKTHSNIDQPDMFSAHSAHRQQSHSHSRQDPTSSRAPVPKLARLLKDGNGKFIFVGDSSNLAFVQNIRRLVKSEIGDCSLTTDPLRHAMVEVIPPHYHPPPGRHRTLLSKPSLAETRELVRSYLLATSGVIDLFDSSEIMDHACQWVCENKVENDGHMNGAGAGEQSEEEFNASIYYLVLAIGMQVRNGGSATKDKTDARAESPSQAELYLSRGRELVASSFMDDPSVLTIQSYALIVFYMLSACRRNGAFMLLGIAVRAAYALGLHRSDISSLFEPRERNMRERVWKSLRVLDLYMSASLGRPPATSEVDGGSVSWEGRERSYEGVQMDGLNSSAMLRICFIFERIMNEVYCRREVSVQLVESISRQYRDWTLQLPTGLRTDGLDVKAGESMGLGKTIGVAHLKGAYYWSIILLTRPFLIFKVSGKIKGRKVQREIEEEEEGARSVTSTLSEACIDAALRSVEIATDLIHTPGVPKRLFMVTNSTFVSALVIGFAIFGDFDRSFPLLSSIDQGIAILAIMAKDDPSARRYESITTYLREAAAEHIRRRDQKEVQRRSKDINSIFGNPAKEGVDQKTIDQGIVIPHDTPMEDSMNTSDGLLDQEPWQLRFDMPSEGGPILTTSGTLAANGDDGGQGPFDLSKYGFDQMAGSDPFSPTGSGIPSLPSYAEEFPLFSLMTEYDQLQDPYQLGVT